MQKKKSAGALANKGKQLNIYNTVPYNMEQKIAQQQTIIYNTVGLLVGAQWSSSCMLDWKVRGPRFKTRPGYKFGSRFLLHVTPTHKLVDTRTSPKTGPQLQ